MLFGEIRKVLEERPTSWELAPDVDDDAEVPDFPVTQLEPPGLPSRAGRRGT